MDDLDFSWFERNGYTLTDVQRAYLARMAHDAGQIVGPGFTADDLFREIITVLNRCNRPPQGTPLLEG